MLISKANMTLTIRLLVVRRSYGSGYPGYAGRGVGGLGFPFIFWPVVWGPGFGYGPGYLHNSEVRCSIDVTLLLTEVSVVWESK